MPPVDVAIIGMACMFPGAPNLGVFWHNIVSKVDAITDPPLDAWDPDIFYDPSSGENDRVYCKKGGYLGSLAYFNPLEHGVMPRTAEGGEPDQWLALQIARDALTDAGYPEGVKEHLQTAVILGKGTYINRGNLTMVQHSLMVDQTLQVLKKLYPEFTDEELQLIRTDLKRELPPFNTETASAMVPNIVAGRIANRLDLMGPSYTVDAACASSLIAVETAVRGLRSREYDLALAGGVQVTTPIPILTLFSQLKALSFQEQIRPFDVDADGTILSEGLGIVILKRLEEAVRDGDRVYAVIKGVGVASDGRGTSVLAPRVEGEEMALRRAYDQTGISPRTVGLIEAHGTATLVGDAAEVEALTHVFGERNGDRPWCALGTVKSMIGHTMPAAGVAGLIKAALALYHKVLPPTLNVDQPSPRLELEKTPFYINTETRPWIHGSAEAPRRAGVNAFGFGGINAHVILEEGPAYDNKLHHEGHQLQWDTEVVILRGESRADLIGQGERLQRFLQAASDVSLKDLAYTQNVQPPTLRRGSGQVTNSQSPARLAIVASSPQDLHQKLDLALERLADPACHKIKTRDGVYFFEEPLGRDGKLAFLFPGEGGQYLNMLADLCYHFPEVRACFDAMDRVYADHSRGYVLSDFVFPRPAFSEEEQKAAEDGLWQMDIAIEALLTANHALYTLLSLLEIQPDAMVGHSTGEYSAMRAAGMLGDESRFGQRLLELNRLYEDVSLDGGVPEAELLAVGANREQVAAITEEVHGELYVAMDNCPHQTVLVGNKEVTERALEHIRRYGLIYETLPFDRAYHTPLFAPYAEVLREFLADWIVAPPQVPLYSCTTIAPFPADAAARQVPSHEIQGKKDSRSNGTGGDLAEIRSIAFEHWVQPVEFRKTIEAMYADGVRLFVEVGPRGNLTAFVDDILRGKPYLAVPANVMRSSGTTQLNHLVGLLAAHGVSMRLDSLYARRAPRALDLDHPADPASKGKSVAGQIKLATGWPPMSISEETAARLRGTTAGRRDSERRTATDEPSLTVDRRPAPTEPEQRGGEAEEPQRSNLQSPTSDVMSAYLLTMENFLEAQQDVMQAYLTKGRGGTSANDEAVTAYDRQAPATTPHPPTIEPELENLGVEGAETPISDLQPFDEAQDGSPIANTQYPIPNTQASAPADTDQILLRLVSERTGYPIEMLDLDLDLEADLGIDSIKRVEILGAFRQETGLQLAEKMDQLAARRTLQEMIDFLATDDPAQNSRSGEMQRSTNAGEIEFPISNLQSPISDLPFIQNVVSLTPGEVLEARCEINLDAYPFLRDHTLGRQPSQLDPTLAGLPVMPFTMSMEMLAEAAQLLVPDQVIIGMRHVRANRWIALEDSRLTLTIMARRDSSASDHAIQVQIHDSDDIAKDQTASITPIFEGTVIFDEAYPDPPTVPAFTLQGERPSKWKPEQLYAEGMFHGPAFRGIVSMDRWGENGAEATLEVLSSETLLPPDGAQTLLTDPVLLDQPGQVVAFWMAEHLEEGYVIFPFHLEALHIYGASMTPNKRVKCQAQIDLHGDRYVRSDLDVVHEDGRLWARFEGWEDRRFGVPRKFFQFLLGPHAVLLGEPWPVPATLLPESSGWQAYRLSLDDFPDGFFTAHGGIWQRTLAHQVLSRRERERWRALRRPERHRLEWLLSRVVAKDAVRRRLDQRYGLRLGPADVEILSDSNGRPIVQGPWTQRVPCVPQVSLSHTAGVAVALAGACDPEEGVGLDIEHVSRMNEDIEALAFTPEEQALLAAMSDAERDEWPLRLWCAKEAVAKAVGQGMLGGPQALVVQDLDTASGIVQIDLHGELARRVHDGSDGTSQAAFTARDGDWIVAAATYRNSNGDDHAKKS